MPKHVFGLLIVLSVLLAGVSEGQRGGRVLVDAHAAAVEAGDSSFAMGTARGADGRTLALNSRYLLLNGKPWIPVMGEFHFSRVPAAEWEDEILKMKAGGVSVIAAYVIWIHHEEVEGTYDWSGDRDLRRFAQLCAKHGMYLYVRIGPWAHGEARNGGFPDWLLKKGVLRTNDPAYLKYVEQYYSAIGKQLQGLLWKDAGPVMGVQLENEYSNRSPGGGEAHLLKLKELAIASGMDVPLYSVTGWDNAVVPAGAVLPVFGGYPDAPWDASLTTMPPSEVYNFRFGSRVSGNMGMIGASGAEQAAAADTPFFTAEMGGGIQDTYHRRPIISADDVAAMYPVMLGSNVNLYGMYMFQGGENPEGKLSTLQESQRTGYPTDVPVKSYDFQAPLSAFGEERESFRKLKMVNYFLQDYGSLLAPMETHAPAVLPKSAEDLSAVRVAVRSSGERGFAFVNNYVRGAAMPERPGFQMEVSLPAGKMMIPEVPVDVPSGAYFIWPFHLALGMDELRYSTAQLMMKLPAHDGVETYVFFCVKHVRCELSFADRSGLKVQASVGEVVHEKDGVKVSGLPLNLDAAVMLLHGDKAATRVLVLTEEHAQNAWRVRMEGEERVLMTSSQFFAAEDQITLQSVDDPHFEAMVFPELHHEVRGSSAVTMTRRGNFTELMARVPAMQPKVSVRQVKQPGEAPFVKIGPAPTWRPTGVAEAPADESFAAAAGEWEVKIDAPHGASVSNLLLQVEYTGDVARLRDGMRLLDDNFYNGQRWEIGLKRFLPAAGAGVMRLEILPLRSDSPIFLENAVRTGVPKQGQVDVLRSVRLLPEYRLTLGGGNR